jgi:uncharacterized membrane protein
MTSKSAKHPIEGHGALAGLFGFVKTTLVGGAVFLVPVTVLALLLAKVGAVLLHLAQPLAKRLPLDTLWGKAVADVVLIVLAVFVCFLAGLLARVSFANRFVRKAEAGVLWRIPGYGFVKGLTDSLDKSPAAKAMVPVLIHFDDAAQLAFEVDHLPDGRRVIYLPGAPDPRAGSVLVMDADRVEPVQMTFVRATAALRALGRGLGPTLSQSR